MPLRARFIPGVGEGGLADPIGPSGQSDDSSIRRVETFVAFTHEPDPFFEEAQGVFESEIAPLQLGHARLELAQGGLEAAGLDGIGGAAHLEAPRGSAERARSI